MRDKFEFRNRAREVSRVEAFSDVVFGFALTLIVVSLEVPRTYRELLDVMRGLPAFAICFATLIWIWYEHHKFFQRYDMKDGVTIVLNATLLFLVLFYTYPLKFIFAVVTGTIQSRNADASQLFVIYSLGFAGIFAMLLTMYLLAWKRRTALRLNEFEAHDTMTSLWMYAAYVVVGLSSTLIAVTVTGRNIKFAGLIYFMLGPISAGIGYWRGMRREELQRRHVASAQPAPNASETIAVPTVAANGP